MVRLSGGGTTLLVVASRGEGGRDRGEGGGGGEARAKVGRLKGPWRFFVLVIIIIRLLLL